MALETRWCTRPPPPNSPREGIRVPLWGCAGQGAPGSSPPGESTGHRYSGLGSGAARLGGRPAGHAAGPEREADLEAGPRRPGARPQKGGSGGGIPRPGGGSTPPQGRGAGRPPRLRAAEPKRARRRSTSASWSGAFLSVGLLIGAPFGVRKMRAADADGRSWSGCSVVGGLVRRLGSRRFAATWARLRRVPRFGRFPGARGKAILGAGKHRRGVESSPLPRSRRREIFEMDLGIGDRLSPPDPSRSRAHNSRDPE